MKYSIKQSAHYSNRWLYKATHYFQNREFSAYSVTFSENCWYPEDYVAYSGWNKIFGFGDIFHHWNSARLVWQPDFDQKDILRIAAYTYERGEWVAIEFSSVPVGVARSMAIWATPTSYRFKCGKDQYEVEHSHPSYTKKLWPYFGGKDRAYKDIQIKLYPIKDINWD